MRADSLGDQVGVEPPPPENLLAGEDSGDEFSFNLS